MEPLPLLGLLAVGLFAGVVNTLAGGGSLLTLPALMWLGLPATVANGTNRVGVLVQSLAAAARYRREPALDGALSRVEVLPAAAGALAGAWVSTGLDETVMRRAIGVMMIVVLLTLFARPSAWLRGRETAAPLWARAVGFLLIGFYGGFLQAGVGVFLLTGFVLLSGRDLVQANAGKVVIVALFTLPALAVYVATDLVRWTPAAVLSVGTAAGGWLGARWNVAWGPGVVRWVVAAVVVLSAVELFSS